jgi:LPXTG-motif cell wall-anchored protein
VPISRGLLVVLAAILLFVPGTVYAQTSTTTIPQDGTGVSKQPPVPLGTSTTATTPAPPPAANPPTAATPRADGPRSAPAATAAELPNTGADPRLLALLGAALTLLGVGLRLQTADADLY